MIYNDLHARKTPVFRVVHNDPKSLYAIHLQGYQNSQEIRSITDTILYK
jgi:hypothetical protein